MEYTVTRALAELKLLEKRIQKSIDSSHFVTTQSKTKAMDVEKFNREASSNYQSIRDLLNLRNRLKVEIVKSNANTLVKIGPHEYSVAEAIERKRSISFEKNLLTKLQQQKTESKNLMDNHEAVVKSKLDRLLEVEFGKDVKSNVDNVNTITKSYLENNKMVLIDPLNIDEKIKLLENDIEEFEKNVDFALSESNARTTIKF